MHSAQPRVPNVVKSFDVFILLWSLVVAVSPWLAFCASHSLDVYLRLERLARCWGAVVVRCHHRAAATQCARFGRVAALLFVRAEWGRRTDATSRCRVRKNDGTAPPVLVVVVVVADAREVSFGRARSKLVRGAPSHRDVARGSMQLLCAQVQRCGVGIRSFRCWELFSWKRKRREGGAFF